MKLTVEIEMTDKQMADYYDEYGHGDTVPALKADVSDHVESSLQSGTLAQFATVKVTRSR